jgi:hypothetical protein
MKAIDRKLVRDLWRLRRQILAIAVVVACGIASFVSMLSAYESLKLSQATYYDRLPGNRFPRPLAKNIPIHTSADIEAQILVCACSNCSI